MTVTKAYTVATAILVELPDGSTKDLQEVMTDILVRLQDMEDEVRANHRDVHDVSADLQDLLSNLRCV